MVASEQARQLALALPEAVEQDHHGRPSFRIAGKIFATQWDEDHMNVMLDEDGIRTAIHSEPEPQEKLWQVRESGLGATAYVRRADAEMLANLLADAWETRAPKRLLRD